MPSGDALSAAMFSLFIKYHFPYLYLSLGESTFLLKFVTLVSIGRVFYHCHYFGDTIIGAIMGSIIVSIFHYSEMTVPAIEAVDQWFHEMIKMGLTKQGLSLIRN